MILLTDVRKAIEWADHLVFVYPTWWGTYPALLKGFLDRILIEGWAFDEITGGTGYAGRLRGRTAELITTMDTPGPIYRLAMRSPGKHTLARATLGFCGIDVVRHTRFGTVRGSDRAKRSRWIDQSRELGMRLRDGVHTRIQHVARRISPWLAAMRLPTMLFSALVAAAAAVLATTMSLAGPAPSVLSWLGVIALIHGGWLVWLILRRRSDATTNARIDYLMVASLTFVIWFGVIPLANLLAAG